MSNFSFKGNTLYRLIPSGGIDLFIPRIVLWGGYNITGIRACKYLCGLILPVFVLPPN